MLLYGVPRGIESNGSHHVQVGGKGTSSADAITGANARKAKTTAYCSTECQEASKATPLIQIEDNNAVAPSRTLSVGLEAKASPL